MITTEEMTIRTIPSFVCRDNAKIFSLCFCTLTDAARDSTFEFVRTADTAVSILELYSQADGIANTVTAP
jgi:hypothetical protein